MNQAGRGHPDQCVHNTPMNILLATPSELSGTMPGWDRVMMEKSDSKNLSAGTGLHVSTLFTQPLLPSHWWRAGHVTAVLASDWSTLQRCSIH